MAFQIENNVLVKYTEEAEKTHVIIPDNVTSIGEEAFSHCENLVSIHLPDQITQIGDHAFSWCENLASIHLSDQITQIGDNAFWGCKNLTSIHLPDHITQIGDRAFSWCKNLTSVHLPDQITQIGDNTFWGCENLASIDIPDTITSIGDEAFGKCAKLTSIHLPDQITQIGRRAFWECENLASIHLSDQITQIGNGAFSRCRSLKTIDIPDNVTSIGNRIFWECENLASIHLPDHITQIGEGAFCRCTHLTKIDIPDGVTHIDAYAFAKCYMLSEIRLPQSIQSIGRYAFYGCYELPKINIPSTEVNIGDGAFHSCPMLVDENGFIIVNNCLYDCVSEKSDINIPDGITTISSQALSSKRTLHSVYIPESVTTLGDYAFEECTNLEEVHLSKRITSIGNGTFMDCKNLKAIHISDSVKSEVSLPDNLITIGKEAFCNCSSLTHISIPDHVTTVDTDAFQNCTNLETISFGMHFPQKADGILSCKKKLRFPPHAVQTLDLSDNVILQMDEHHPTDEDVAYLLLKKTGKTFLSFLLQTDNPAANVMQKVCELQKDGSLSKRQADFIADYIKGNLRGLSSENLTNILAFFEKTSPKTAGILADLPEIKQKISGKACHPVEVFVADAIAASPLHTKVSLEIKKGLPYADGSGVSSVSVVAFIISEYAKIYEENAHTHSGDFSSVQILENGYTLPFSKAADQAAQALEKNALLKFLFSKMDARQYRLYLLACARYADETYIQEFISKMNASRRGKAKERYWAQNAQEALYLNDTHTAAVYFDKKELLDRYTQMRGMDIEEYRIQNMLPTFGLENGDKLYYDVGDTIVEAILTADLTFRFFDPSSGKTTKSFPKKAGDPEKNADCAAEFSKTQKAIKELIKMHTLKLQQMHVYGTSIRQRIWKAAYLEHPVLKKLARLLVWKDEQNATFVIDEDNRILNARSRPYEPQGDITLAHVLDMKQAEIFAWQKYLTDKKQKQLFAQIWEPVVINEAVLETLSDRYNGAVLTNSERAAFRTKMKNKGIDVHAEEIDAAAYFFENGQFYTDNDMYLGRYLEIHYTIDIKDNTITLEHLYLNNKSPDKKELNALIAELDIITMRHQVQEDRAQMLSNAILETLTLMQLNELLEISTKNRAVNCSAVLLNYKNKRFPDFDPMDEFTLE